MSAPVQFEMGKGYAVFRVAGHATAEAAASMFPNIVAAIAAAREHKIQNLLVDISGMTELSVPNVATRYFAVREWADASRGMVRVALLAQAHMLDPEKFSAVVASNLGFRYDTFSSEAEAVAWLQRAV